VPVLFPCGKIERERLDLSRLFPLVLEFGIELLDLVLSRWSPTLKSLSPV